MGYIDVYIVISVSFKLMNLDQFYEDTYLDSIFVGSENVKQITKATIRAAPAMSLAGVIVGASMGIVFGPDVYEHIPGMQNGPQMLQYLYHGVSTGIGAWGGVTLSGIVLGVYAGTRLVHEMLFRNY